MVCNFCFGNSLYKQISFSVSSLITSNYHIRCKQSQSQIIFDHLKLSHCVIRTYFCPFSSHFRQPGHSESREFCCSTTNVKVRKLTSKHQLNFTLILCHVISCGTEARLKGGLLVNEFSNSNCVPILLGCR